MEPKTSEKFPEIQITPSFSNKIFKDVFCLSNSNSEISLDFESSVENLVVNYDENAENFVEHDFSDNKSDSENSVNVFDLIKIWRIILLQN